MKSVYFNQLFILILQAAYMLSKCKNIVMCIQDVNSETIDNGNTVSISIKLSLNIFPQFVDSSITILLQKSCDNTMI